MSSPRSIRRYTEKWMELFDWFVDHPKETLQIECTSQPEACRLRLEFYRARSALLKTVDFAAMYQDALDQRELKVRGNILICDSKDNNWAARLLATSLERAEETWNRQRLPNTEESQS